MRNESPFKVRLRDISLSGHRVALDLTADWTSRSLAGHELGWRAGLLHVEFELHKADRDVVARAQLTGELTCACSRCAGDARHTLRTPFDVTFVPADTLVDDERDAAAVAEAEREIAAGEADVASYDDEQIDLEPTLREQLLLALPYAPLCTPDCRGLCARCGKDLNEGACSCAPEEALDTGRKNPFAALKNVKL